MNLITLLYLVMISLASNIFIARAQQCLAPQTDHFKITIITTRNITGQWNTQVQLQREEGLNSEDKTAGPWKVDVDHTSVKCKDKESLMIVVSASGPAPVLGPDYELVPEVGYYKLHKTAKTWEEGRKVCSQEGTHLAIINSDREAAVLRAILLRNPDIDTVYKNEWAYIGIHDQYSEGNFVTIFNQPLSSTGYEKWNLLQPGNNTLENCGLVNGNSGRLGDTECYQKLAFFCEREL